MELHQNHSVGSEKRSLKTFLNIDQCEPVLSAVDLAMETKTIKKYWLEVVHYLDLAENNEKLLFQDIVNNYSQKNRYYHNLNHISTLLKLIDSQHLNGKDRITLILTAFYHDVVYDTKQSMNESESVVFLKRHFDHLIEHKVIIDDVAQIIIDTKNHQSESFLSQLFLDMDLSILGTDEVSYSVYSASIQKEYQQIPVFLYHIGRNNFIRTMLKKGSIFYTQEFKNKYEKQAIQNLKNELANAQSSLKVCSSTKVPATRKRRAVKIMA